MRRMPLFTMVCGWALLAVFSGCRSLSLPVTYYTLSPLAASSAKTAVNDHVAVTIGILPVELPGYANRTQMVIRKGPNQLEISSLHRWADYPDRLVQQIIAENLQVLVPHAHIVTSPWPVGLKPDITIAFKFGELIATTEKQVLLNGMWSIAGLDSMSAAKLYQVNLVEPIRRAGFDKLAAAHSHVLAILCRQVAESLQPLRS